MRRSYVHCCPAAVAIICFALPSFAVGFSIESREDGFDEARLQALCPESGRPIGQAQFGWSLAAAEGVVVASSPNQRAYVFRRHNDSWEEEIAFSPASGVGSFGYTVTLDGGTLAISGASSLNAGMILLYERRGSQWIEQPTLRPVTGGSGDGFGSRMAIDGDTMAIGAPGVDGRATDGAVYVFRRHESTWTEEAKLFLPETSEDFSMTVAVSDNILVAGRAGFDTGIGDPGQVFVFRRAGQTWRHETTLELPFRTGGDRFGAAVGVSGHTIVVGAPGRDEYGLNAGVAYVYEWSGSRWIGPDRLVSNDIGFSDGFGFAVGIDGAALAIGAAFDQGFGAAYLFRRRGRGWQQETKFTDRLEPGERGSYASRMRLRGDTIVAADPSRDEASGIAYVYEPTTARLLLGPGIQSGPVGDEMDFAVTFDARAATVSELVFETATDLFAPTEAPATAVTCTPTDDLSDAVVLSGSLLEDPVRLRLQVSPTGERIPRDGLLGYCRVRLIRHLPVGVMPLRCDADSAHSTATDAGGNPVAADCEDGELRVLPCVGDCDEDGQVTVSELVTGVSLALGTTTLGDQCAAFDGNSTSAVEIDELVKAVGNALQSPC